jgi:hypothetical protein
MTRSNTRCTTIQLGESLDKLGYTFKSGGTWQLCCQSSVAASKVLEENRGHFYRPGAKFVDTDEERMATILNASTTAVSKACPYNARTHMECAFDMMRGSDYETDYDLCIDLLNRYAEVSYCTGHFEDSDKAMVIFLRETTNEKDRFMICQNSHEKMLDCWVLNVVLKDLGERIPPRPSHANVLRELIRPKLALRKTEYRDFLSMPRIMNERKLVKYGISAFTSAALAMLLGMMNKIDDNMYDLGKYLLKCLRGKDTVRVQDRCAYPYRERLTDLAKPMLESYRFGLMSGADSYTACCGLFVYLSARNEF